MFILKEAVASLVALLLIAISHPIVAQELYPNRPITMIIPFEPGSTTDIIGRQLAIAMSGSMGQPVVIENRPGSGGMIGTRVAVRAKPDGYTILYASNGITSEQSLRQDSGFDVLRDLAPITDTISTPLSILVHKNVPVKSLAELIEYAKKNPGKLNYGSSGIGGTSHLAAGYFAGAAGINIQHVPYKGAAPAMTAVLANEVQMILLSPGASNELVEAGSLRALAVTSATRSSVAPNLPTVQESGFANFEYNIWWGFFAPSGTPDSIVKKLHHEIAVALKQPKIADGLKVSGYEVGAKSPEEFRARVSNEVKNIGDVIRQNGIKAQ